MGGRERSNPLCHQTARGKHTGRKRKLGIAEGVVNIMQCNVTAWSEHTRHFSLTSDFDAALISETHLEEAKHVAADKEARKPAWACTGSAAVSTANNGTSAGSAGVLALVRTRWFSKPLSTCTDEAGVLCPTHGWRGGSFASWAGKSCCSQLISNILWDFAAISGADFNFPPSQIIMCTAAKIEGRHRKFSYQEKTTRHCFQLTPGRRPFFAQNARMCLRCLYHHGARPWGWNTH